ncbi:hypothetical protein CAEBREN_16931 [Caenorhabditis brenneri]|uniref:Uncharacterized protein n=1 Tax=Caenorhabditis brenneri TaxID=135651 RepID=G0MMI0_CAEBE|nr:hypothetical protein CAEBREN_16931 [Caenorhabditis brenneri]
MVVASICIAGNVSMTSAGIVEKIGFTMDITFRTPRFTRPNQRKIAPYLLPFNYHKRRLGSTDESSSMLESRRVLMYSYVYAYHQKQGMISKDFKQFQNKLKDRLDLANSRENVEKCEQLRKSILDYCNGVQTGKENGTRKSNDRCNIISSVFVVLLFCCIPAVMIMLYVFLPL